MRQRIVTAVTLLFALIGSYRWAYLPYRCGVDLKPLDRSIREASAHRGSTGAAIVAQRTAERLHRLPSCCKETPLYLMTAGTASLLLERPAEAAVSYRALLQHDRRPEVYFALGHAELAMGQYDQALVEFEQCVRFDPFFIAAVPSGTVRAEIEHRILQDESVRRSRM